MHRLSRKKSPLRTNQQVLRIHRAIVNKLIQKPELMNAVQQKLEHRYEQGLMRYGAYITWHSLIDLFHSDPELFGKEVLLQDEKMEKLRRKTIFVGVLTEDERQAACNS